MVAGAWLCSLKYSVTPLSLPIAHTACGCSSGACSRTCLHKPVTRAGLQSFTLTLARGCLQKQSCECLSPDGAKYFYTSLPQSLSLCITARKRYGRKIRAARRRRGQVTPNLQLYFQASQLNYSANWALRKSSTSCSQVTEHGTDELCSAAAIAADVAALCRSSWLSWGSPCVFAGFPGCSGGPQPRLKTPFPWWSLCFSLLGLCVCSQKWESAGGHSWSCPMLGTKT